MLATKLNYWATNVHISPFYFFMLSQLTMNFNLYVIKCRHLTNRGYSHHQNNKTNTRLVVSQIIVITTTTIGRSAWPAERWPLYWRSRRSCYYVSGAAPGGNRTVDKQLRILHLLSLILRWPAVTV